MLHSFYKSASGFYVVFFSSNDPSVTDTELFRFRTIHHAVEMVSILNGGSSSGLRIQGLADYAADVERERENA